MKKNSKTIANISLGIMSLGFFGSMPLQSFLAGKLLQGGFEAGLVGGLADWFAVTALFRHPLNLRIPHTALLPKNREKLVKGILSTVENQWLNKESILNKIEQINVSNKLVQKIEEELSKESAKKQIKSALLHLSEKIDMSQFEGNLETGMRKISSSIDIKPLVPLLINKIIESKYEEKIFDEILLIVERKVSNRETRQAIKDYAIKVLKEKSNNGLFGMVLKPLLSMNDKKIGETIDKIIDDLVSSFKDKKNPNRIQILFYFQNELTQLKTNENFLNKIDEMKNDALKNFNFNEISKKILLSIQNKIQSSINDDEFIEKNIIHNILNFVRHAKDNPEQANKIEKYLKEQIAIFVDANHSKITKIVEDNLNKLNNEELIDMLEDKIGKELSWIRVNGSLCGFLIGIFLTTIKLFLN